MHMRIRAKQMAWRLVCWVTKHHWTNWTIRGYAVGARDCYGRYCVRCNKHEVKTVQRNAKRMRV